MTRKVREERCCTDGPSDSCRVEALVSVDERGQMVLPKDLRDRAGMAPGDKLAVVSWAKDGVVCCITLIKADHLAGHVKDFIAPIMGGMPNTY